MTLSLVGQLTNWSFDFTVLRVVLGSGQMYLFRQLIRVMRGPDLTDKNTTTTSKIIEYKNNQSTVLKTKDFFDLVKNCEVPRSNDAWKWQPNLVILSWLDCDLTIFLAYNRNFSKFHICYTALDDVSANLCDDKIDAEWFTVTSFVIDGKPPFARWALFTGR